jgi:ribosome-associated heat shock protein Hsp15
MKAAAVHVEPVTGEILRLDKWLWHARFFKSRTQAASFCTKGRLRLNRRHIDRASAPVRVGDVLTFPLGAHIKVVRVRALGVRRGPPPEARTLYEDLAPASASPPDSRDWKTTDLPSPAAPSR